MLVIILLIVLLALILYKSYVSKNKKNINNINEYEINESTFNPSYKISKDKNGLEIVQSCGR